jgi:glycosyltransferase involved in cell wall biosynthesis
VLTLWTNEQERAHLQHLEQQCHQVLAISMPLWRSLFSCGRAVLTREPLQSVYSWHPDLLTLLKEKAYDVVHVEHLRGVRYGLRIKEQGNLPVVWDSVDCISHLFRQASAQRNNRLKRWVMRFELERTERYESWLPHQFDEVLVTSPVDKAVLSSLTSDNLAQPAISVLPNGVDLDYFQPETAVTRDPATLVISGKMSYHANVSMALHMVHSIMPRVWAQRPEVQLCIVGKDPPREIQALDQHPAITVTGTVKDIRPYLQRATIAVAALTYGAGIQNKVLEAMACATPVVATESAVSALMASPGTDLLVAKDAEGFSQAILALLADPARRQAVGTAGRRYVERQHNWGAIAAQLEQVYDGLISRRCKSNIRAYTH